jgi:hypothetical protein
MAANVVLLPEPVGPVTSTRPRGRSEKLLEHVAAEAREIRNTKREVQLVFHLEALLLVFREYGIRQLERVAWGEDMVDHRVHDITVHAHLRPVTGRDVEIGGIALDHLVEQRAE